MEIVIKIHEKDYQAIKNGHIPFSVHDAIMKGTPLPEHHGRIIDESKIKKVYYHIETSEYERFRIEHAVIDGTDAPTIIERSDGND